LAAPVFARSRKKFSPPPVGGTPAWPAVSLAQRRSAVWAAETAVGAVGLGVGGRRRRGSAGWRGRWQGRGDAPEKDMVDMRCPGLLPRAAQARHHGSRSSWWVRSGCQPAPSKEARPPDPLRMKRSIESTPRPSAGHRRRAGRGEPRRRVDNYPRCGRLDRHPAHLG
jgi:hypothetical protein